MKNISLLIVLIMILSCNSQIKKDETIYWDKDSNKSFISMIENVDVCKLETSDSCLIGENSQLLCCDSYFYIIDRFGSKTIRKFDNNGKYITSIGNHGRGEEEFTSIRTVYIDNLSENIYVLSADNKILTYRKNGKYIDTQTISFSSDGFVKNGDDFLFYLGYSNGFSDDKLIKTDVDYNVKEGYLPLKTKAIHLMDDNNFYTSRKHVFLKESFGNIIYTIEKDSVKQFCHFDFGEYNVEKKYFNFDNPFNGYQYLNNNGFASIYRYMNNGETSYIELNLQKQGNSDRVFGIERRGKWNWINKKHNTGVKILKGVFQHIVGNNKLVGIINPTELLELYKIAPQLFRQKNTMNSIHEDDNPLVLTVTLK